jgi:hypothetical protein
MVRRADGIDWAVLFNTRDDLAGKPLQIQIDGLVNKAADEVRLWPAGDLFPVPAPAER